MRIVCLSDTHSLHDRVRVPDGDVLVHAGDMTMRGSGVEVAAVGKWLASLPHPHKVVISGNHDWAFAREHTRMAAISLLGDVHYLEGTGVEIDGVQFWGGPWQPWFHDWAFNLPRDGDELRRKWAAIPEVDVLVTHGPPHGILDQCPDRHSGSMVSVGDRLLLQAVERVGPRMHVFGHIHEGYGQTILGSMPDTRFVNAAICTASYNPTNVPIVVDL